MPNFQHYPLLALSVLGSQTVRVCVCVCACVDGINFKCLLSYYVGMSTHQFILYHASTCTCMHAHMHTHLIPFEGRKPTGLKVDIAKLSKRFFLFFSGPFHFHCADLPVIPCRDGHCWLCLLPPSLVCAGAHVPAPILPPWVPFTECVCVCVFVCVCVWVSECACECVCVCVCVCVCMCTHACVHLCLYLCVCVGGGGVYACVWVCELAGGHVWMCMCFLSMPACIECVHVCACVCVGSVGGGARACFCFCFCAVVAVLSFPEERKKEKHFLWRGFV